MGWRRGELWLDVELWAGEPAAAGLAPIPSFGPPPGLAASRQRRAAWERRRELRKTRTTVAALSPALVVLIAALRSGSDRSSAAIVEDPPTFTIRWNPTSVGPIRLKERPDTATPVPVPAPHHARATGADEVRWHHATPVGLPYAGSLIGGTQLPASGPNWVTWDPVTDSLPNEATRLYGTERTIRAVVSVAHAYRAANPKAPRVVVGDISREGGGPMTDEHVSHQNGLDVDVYYPRLDGKLRAPAASAQIDRRLSQDLLDRFVAAGAQVIFVGFSTGLSGPGGVVVPYPNHEYHMHVRFPPGG